MDNNTGRPTMLNSLNVSKTGLSQATHIDAEQPGQKLKFSSGLALDSKDFVIGQRVYVGGTRPGQIGYIGETHFAPGEWIGVVLDEPNGKNDGCVAGKRYFQCEPKRGVFSRTNRLTLQPVLENDFDLSRATSPATSIRSSIPTKVTGSISKRDLQVGNRVIVSSGFGSKPGELKYLGETKFAPGTWCGVQLDDQNGKNDGTVDGVQYFECPDKYGIFVPIAKVSLSPLAKMGNHSRMGSQESLTSVGTMNSIATTNTSRLRMSLLKGRRPSTSGGSLGYASTPLPKSASKNAFSLQDVLKERQNYIEQLITERELDREDVQAQTILFQKQIADSKEYITNLDMQLIESTKKLQEFQSSTDEIQFCNDELLAQNQVYKEKISQLENKLSDDMVPNNNVGETCEKCPVLLKEIEDLKLQIQNLLSELESIKLSNLNDKTLDNLRTEIITKDAQIKEIQLNILEMETLQLELMKTKENVEAELVIVNEKHKESIENLNFKLEESNSKFEEGVNVNMQLKEIIEKNKMLQMEEAENIDKLKAHVIELQHQIAEHVSNLDKNSKEVNLKESLLKEKLTEIEDLYKQLTQLGNEKNSLVFELNKTQNDLASSQSDNDSKVKELNNINEKLNESINNCHQMTAQNKQMSELNKKLDTELSQTNSKLSDLEKNYDKLSQIKITLQNEMKKINENLSDEQVINTEKTIQLNSKLIDSESNVNKLLEENTKLKNSLKEINDKNLKILSEIEQLKSSYNNIEFELNAKNLHISNLESINKKVIGNLDRNTSELNEKIKYLQDVQEQLSQLKLEKNIVEISLKSALENTNKTSIETQKFHTEKNSEIELLQKDLQVSLKKIDELNLNLKSTINDNSKQQQELNNNIQKQKIEIELNCEKILKLETEVLLNVDIANKLKDENHILNKKLQDENEVLGKLKADYSKLEIDMKNEEDKNEILNIKCNELKLEKQDLQNKLINDNENLTMNAKTEISNLTESLVEKQKELEQVEINLNELQMNLSKSEKMLDLQKLESERIIAEYKEEKLGILNEVEKLRSIAESDQQKHENLKREYLEHKELKLNEINNLNETITGMKEERLELNSVLDKLNKSSEVNQTKFIDEIKELTDERNRLLSDVELLNKNINAKELDYASLQENLNLKGNQLFELNKYVEKISLDLKESIDNNDKFKIDSNSAYAEYQLQLKNTKELHAIMEKEKEKFENMYESSQEQCSNVEKKYVELQENFNKINAELERLKVYNFELQENLNVDSSKLSDTEKTIQKFQKNILELENSKEMLNQEKQNLLNENKKLKNNTIEIEKESITKITDLNDELKLKDIQINDLSLNSNNLKSSLDILYQEKNNLEITLNQNIEELKQDKIKLENDISLKTEENVKLKSDIENILTQNENLNQVLVGEKNKLSEDLLQMQDLVKTKNDEILSLKEIEDTIKQEYNKSLEEKNLEVKNLLNNLEALKREMLNENKKLLEEKNIEIDNLLKTLEKVKTEFTLNQDNAIKNISVENSTEIAKIKENIIKLELANEILIKDNANLKDELLVCEQDKQDALNNIELFGVEHDQNFDLIKENNMKLQREYDYLTASLNQKEKQISESKDMYEQINLLLKDKNSMIAKLQIENNDLIKSLEMQQKQDEISIAIEPIEKKKIDLNNKADHINEINFLNSIIADMHKKNEDLKSRIDAIEMMPSGDFDNSGVNRYMADFLSATIKKLPAPRLFCDICDIFDKHDTEDCPLQESDDIQDFPAKDDTKTKVKPPPRKYCDSCEVFGHEKGECANDECF